MLACPNPDCWIRLPVTEEIRAQCLVGQTLYLAAATRGLRVIDLADRLHPERLPDVETTHAVGQMAVADQTLALTSPSGLTRSWYSLQDPRQPRLLRQTIAPDPAEREDCADSGTDADATSDVGVGAAACNRCGSARRGPARTVRLRSGSVVTGWLLHDGSAGLLDLCVANGTRVMLAAGEWSWPSGAPSPGPPAVVPVGVARVFVTSNVPISLTRIRPNGEEKELGSDFQQRSFDLLTTLGYQARASGYMTARFILRTTDRTQSAAVTLARPTGRVLGIASAVIGTAGLVAAVYSAVLASSASLIPIPFSSPPDVNGYWVTAGISAAVGVAFMIPAVGFLVWGPRSRVVVSASDPRTVPPPRESD